MYCPCNDPALFCASYLGRINISDIYLAGVESALSAHSRGLARGIKAHFTMDASGLLNITSVSLSR